MISLKNLFFINIIVLTTFFFICCNSQNTDSTVTTDSISVSPFVQIGKASYYANSLQGNTMANGTAYKKTDLVAAHTTLPLGTKVKVTNLSTNDTVIVEIADRGPYVRGRIIDLSKVAAKKLGFVEEGETEVKLEVIEAAEGYAMSDSTDRKG